MQSELITQDLQSQILHSIVSEVMDIKNIGKGKPNIPGSVQFEGDLRLEPAAAYKHLSNKFLAMDYTALFRQEGKDTAILALPGRIAESTSRLWLAILLFLLTVVSTIFMGGLGESGIPLGGMFEGLSFNVAHGLSFSVSLLSILLAHELGHFLMARKMGVSASYPFFIPMPFSPIGTMGAFIAMKSPPPDRRALLAIAIAGPLAGLVVAIPVLYIGLSLSQTGPLVPPYFLEGNSLLYAGLKFAVFGKFLPHFAPEGATDVLLHPVAFAGWVGLLVTGLNLIPAGQLDGGHIFYALVGPRAAQKATWVIALILLAAGFLWWYGWFIWAMLILLLGRQRAALLNELVPLTNKQKLLAVVGLIIFVLVFTPVPFTVAGM